MAKPAPPAEELREGIKLGQWTLGRELGKGAFGAVYEGERLLRSQGGCNYSTYCGSRARVV